MRYLLGPNIVSNFTKPIPSKPLVVLTYEENDENLFIASLTLMEALMSETQKVTGIAGDASVGQRLNEGKSSDPPESASPAASSKEKGWPIIAYVGVVTAFLGALTAALSEVPLLVNAFKSACFALALCNPTPVPPPAPTAVVQLSPLPVSYVVQINDLLPEYSKIIASLKKANIQLSRPFGHDSVNPALPGKFVIAIGPEFPIDTFQIIVGICSDNGLDGVFIASDPRNYRALYVGALAYEPYTALTEQLKNSLLSHSLTWPELQKLVNAQ